MSGYHGKGLIQVEIIAETLGPEAFDDVSLVLGDDAVDNARTWYCLLSIVCVERVTDVVISEQSDYGHPLSRKLLHART
jgi:hypothetical protein